ncbi:MAG: acyl--CoA ligase [Alphaproteobacteria bacterium]|nr:acyl--CoA ligase [Alphaproteobacteria bacterium]
MSKTPNVGALLSPGADPARIALWDYSAGAPPRAWSAGELDALASALARGLLKRGLKRGDSIVVLAANRAEFVALYFGAMRVGIVVVPVNWKLAAETVAIIVEDAEAKLVFADRDRAALAPASVPLILFDSPEWDALPDPGPVEIIEPDFHEPAQILYTSGSTGRPKGVPLSHRGQHWMVSVVTKEDNSQHRLIVAAPMYHMNALFNLKFAFLNRAQLVLQPVFTAESYVKAIVTHKATWLTCVPTMMAMVANYLGDTPPPAEFAGVTRLFMGSSPYSSALVDRVRALFPNARITNGYGTTEAGAAVYGPHPDGIPAPDAALGYPIPQGETRLVAPDGTIVEGEGEGILQMRNPATMQGYRNMPDKTATALRDGWYHSGDVVRRDAQGFHHFVGREDDMFVCGGENIWPAEVERLLETHPQISQAVVVPIPDAIKQRLPVAFVTLREGASLTEAEVKQWTIARGPAYQHPRHVFFLPAIPLAGTNKIDRTGLVKRAAELASR